MAANLVQRRIEKKKEKEKEQKRNDKRKKRNRIRARDARSPRVLRVILELRSSCKVAVCCEKLGRIDVSTMVGKKGIEKVSENGISGLKSIEVKELRGDGGDENVDRRKHRSSL